ERRDVRDAALPPRPLLVARRRRVRRALSRHTARPRMTARADYPHVLVIPTRWKDNDVYGHVNNVEYYSFFDTVINEYLISEGGLDIHAGEVIGVCAESHCEYHGPIAFPESIDACLRVGRLGRSSSRYEIALF